MNPLKTLADTRKKEASLSRKALTNTLIPTQLLPEQQWDFKARKSMLQ